MTDTHAASELKIYIDNDGDLYRRQTTSILKSLATKKARGLYKHDLAVKAFGYLVQAGAKKYANEFEPTLRVWHQIFDAPTRRVVAEELTKDFETEYDLGNYDRLLPKKYQKQAKTQELHAAKRVTGGQKFKIGDIVRRTAARMRSMDIVSGPVNGIVVGYSGKWPLIRWSDMGEADEPMTQAEEGLELDKRVMSRRGHASKKDGFHTSMHDPKVLRAATDRQLRGFYREEKRDVAKARAEAARRGLPLHASKRRAQLDREISELVPSWRGGR